MKLHCSKRNLHLLPSRAKRPPPKGSTPSTSMTVKIASDERKLSPNQAGFRFLHSTEGQVLRISQQVSNGLNSTPMKRTMMTLIDFSRAFDTVWKRGLYKKLYDLDVPEYLILWIKAFLSDRIAQVMYGSAHSRYRSMVNGLPQGSVLSPILFICFINDICDDMGVEVSLFADDLAILLLCAYRLAAVRRFLELLFF